jgi:hypothetical protein
MELLVPPEIFNVVYIWTYVWQRWKSSLSICCTMFQHWINAESFPVSQLCVNTLPATKITLVRNGIQFGSLRVNILFRIMLQCAPGSSQWRFLVILSITKSMINIFSITGIGLNSGWNGGEYKPIEPNRHTLPPLWNGEILLLSY